MHTSIQVQIAKFKCRKYQATALFGHFAKCNVRQIVPLYSRLNKEGLLIMWVAAFGIEVVVRLLVCCDCVGISLS